MECRYLIITGPFKEQEAFHAAITTVLLNVPHDGPRLTVRSFMGAEFNEYFHPENEHFALAELAAAKEDAMWADIRFCLRADEADFLRGDVADKFIELLEAEIYAAILKICHNSTSLRPFQPSPICRNSEICLNRLRLNRLR
jgi:hypothetical protein